MKRFIKYPKQSAGADAITASTSANTQYDEMRNAVLNELILEDYVGIDFDWGDLIYEIYGQVERSLPLEDLDIVPSVQSSYGTVYAKYTDVNGDTVHAEWDFHQECEDIHEMVIRCETLTAFKESLRVWLLDKLTNVI